MNAHELSDRLQRIGCTLLRAARRGVRKLWCMLLRRRLLGHAVAIYSENGVFLGGTRGDLWPEATREPSWIVDTNIPWERFARAEPQSSFILGRTMVLESDSLRSVITRLEQQPLPNVYTLEGDRREGRFVLLLDRACDTLQLKFRNRIRRIQSMTDDEIARVNSAPIREEKRRFVRNLCREDPNQLLQRIRRDSPRCCRNYRLAMFVSLGAFALHLQELRRLREQDRLDRFDRNDPHVFGDAELLQDALFLGVGVFSDDRTDVGNLAAILGVRHRTSGTT